MTRYTFELSAEDWWLSTAVHDIASKIEYGCLLDELYKKDVAQIELKGANYECKIIKQE